MQDPRLSVRPIHVHRRPDYPGLSIEPPSLVRRRYGESVLDRMRRGLGRPLVVFGLFASLQLPAAGDDDPPRDPPRLDSSEDPHGRSTGEVRMLSREEIAGLVAGLERIEIETGVMVRGEVAGQMGYLTEEEGRAVLEALFRKNGLALARDVRVQGGGLDLVVDGFDPARNVGFEFLGPADPNAWEFQPRETDVSPDEMAELALERARGERAILVLDGKNYAYNVEYMSNLPSKAEAVDRLLEDVRRFLVWLGAERR